MHHAARLFVEEVAKAIGPRRFVLEFGSLDINGSVRSLFGDARYLGIDRVPGPGVDVVADAATWPGPGEFDLADTVVCCETMEHTPHGREIVDNAARCLSHGGVLIVTAATIGRAAHSAIDGGRLRPGEYYGDVLEADLRDWLGAHFETIHIEVNKQSGDIYAFARRT